MKRTVALLALAALLVLPAAAQAEQTLTVKKTGSGTGTVTSAPAGIECGQTCSFAFPDASAVTLKGAPALHSQAVRWSGCDKVTFKNECVLAMSAAKEVIARFDILPEWAEYTITVQRTGSGQGTVVSSPAGIDCGEDCSSAYLHYTQLTLSATPAPGSAFLEWVGGGCAGQTGPCVTTVNRSSLIKAVFAAVGTRILTISKAGAGQGTVTSAPAGIECGAVCAAELDVSTKVTLKATPAPGSTFVGWSGEGCSGAGACKVKMNEARSVTATFTTTSPPPHCLVPRLAGKTLARARAALVAANCSLGSVKKPKGAKLSALRVRSFAPAPGSVLAAGATVNLRLARARRH